MSPQSPPIFDSSFSALGLVQAGHAARYRSQNRIPRLVLPRTGRNAVAMTIQYAPEVVPTVNVLDLTEDQTTGPLSLGFEFEFFGTRYSWFDLSADGFVTFGIESRALWPGSRPGRRFIPMSRELDNFLALGWAESGSLERVRVSYELRGSVGRHRMVLSLTGSPAGSSGRGILSGQLIFRERTGMIDVYTTRYATDSSLDERGVRFTTTSSHR